MDANEVLTALNAKLLNKAYVDKERANLVYVAKSARDSAEAEVLELEARFHAEAPLRAAREIVAQSGFRRSEHDDSVWIRKNKRTGRWDRFSAEQVAKTICG